jgi:hypothetical protein
MYHLLLFVLFISSFAVGSATLRMNGRTVYSRTQYLLPCDICINALKYQSYTPSPHVVQFQKKINSACRYATSEIFQQQSCVAILTKYSHPLVNDQMKGVSFQKSCVRTFTTNCVESTANFTVYCNRRKKKGHCQVIPL